MTDDQLRADARRVAGGLLIDASDRPAITVPSPLALSMAAMLQMLADRIGPAASGHEGCVRTGRALERREIAAMLQGMADKAGEEQRREGGRGRRGSALAAGAASVAYEHAARSVIGRGS